MLTVPYSGDALSVRQGRAITLCVSCLADTNGLFLILVSCSQLKIITHNYTNTSSKGKTVWSISVQSCLSRSIPDHRKLKVTGSSRHPQGLTLRGSLSLISRCAQNVNSTEGIIPAPMCQTQNTHVRKGKKSFYCQGEMIGIRLIEEMIDRPLIERYQLDHIIRW